MSYTATITAFLLGFHSKNRVPPTTNGSTTATTTIKSECLAHHCHCVEQDFKLLYLIVRHLGAGLFMITVQIIIEVSSI